MLQETDDDKFKMYLTRKVIAWFRRWPCKGDSKVIGASSSDTGGDASSSSPGSAAAVAAPKAHVQALTVSEDDVSTDLIVPDGEGGASVGDK